MVAAAHGFSMEIIPALSVRTLKWLPVVTANGPETLTLDDAFIRAHEIITIEYRDPVVIAALNRFLISVGVLVAREAGVTAGNAAEVAAGGFDAAAVARAFDRVDEHLHLLHPATPFMQAPILAETDDLATAAAGGKQRKQEKASTIFPRTPGSTAKAWFDNADGLFNTPTLTPEEAVIGLICHWFYSPKSNNLFGTMVDVVDADGTITEKKLEWRCKGSIGLAGSGDQLNSLTFWHKGANLIEFVLMNVAENWLTDGTQLAWMEPYSLKVDGASLAGSTWGGNAVYLRYDADLGVFTHALRAGFPYGNSTVLAKEGAVDQLKASSKADPSRVWVTNAQDEMVQFRGFQIAHTASQNLAAWYSGQRTPKKNSGVLPNENGALKVLVMLTKMVTGNPEILSAGFLEIAGAYLTETGEETHTELLISNIASSASREPERALKAAIAIALPKKMYGKRAAAVAAKAVQIFHTRLEPAFAAALATMAAGEPASLRTHVDAAKVRAYDDALFAELSTRTLPAIALGRATLTGARVRSEEPVSPLQGFVARFIKQRGGDVSFRVQVTHNNHPGLTRILEALPECERVGATAAMQLLAQYPRLSHQPSSTLPKALANLTYATKGSFNGISGVSADVARLPGSDVSTAVRILGSLLNRLANENVPVNFHDVVDVFMKWNQPDRQKQTVHRNELVFAYFAGASRKNGN
jgi:hypothetical protein